LPGKIQGFAGLTTLRHKIEPLIAGMSRWSVTSLNKNLAHTPGNIFNFRGRTDCFRTD